MSKMKINHIEFKTKGLAQKEARRILNESELYKPLNDSDKNFMIDWFRQIHEEPQRKFGAGVKSLSIRMNYQYSKSGTRGFWITRIDGTETDISYLPKRSQHTKVTKALRTAVQPTIDEFRMKHGVIVGAHIDHAGDWPFSRIVSEFERQIGCKVEKLKVKSHNDGDMTNYLQDENIAARFKAFHDNVCQLEYLDAKENMQKGNKGFDKSLIDFIESYITPHDEIINDIAPIYALQAAGQVHTGTVSAVPIVNIPKLCQKYKQITSKEIEKNIMVNALIISGFRLQDDYWKTRGVYARWTS